MTTMRWLRVAVVFMLGTHAASDPVTSRAKPKKRRGPPAPEPLPTDDGWMEDVKELVFVHGFCHSGTTIVADRLKLTRFTGGTSCWIGRNIYYEAQWQQTLYPSWKPKEPRNEEFCKNASYRDWAQSATLEGKQAYIDGLVAEADRPATATALLKEWRRNGAIRMRSPGQCRTWIAKDPRFDTLRFLPRLFQTKATTSLLVMRHGDAAVPQQGGAGKK